MVVVVSSFLMSYEFKFWNKVLKKIYCYWIYWAKLFFKTIELVTLVLSRYRFVERNPKSLWFSKPEWEHYWIKKCHSAIALNTYTMAINVPIKSDFYSMRYLWLRVQLAKHRLYWVFAHFQVSKVFLSMLFKTYIIKMIFWVFSTGIFHIAWDF